jgi:hypothetical protein
MFLIENFQVIPEKKISEPMQPSNRPFFIAFFFEVCMLGSTPAIANAHNRHSAPCNVCGSCQPSPVAMRRTLSILFANRRIRMVCAALESAPITQGQRRSISSSHVVLSSKRRHPTNNFALLNIAIGPSVSIHSRSSAIRGGGGSDGRAIRGNDSGGSSAGRLVLTHSTHIPGLVPLLRRLATTPGVATIVPGRLYAGGGCGGGRGAGPAVRVTVPTGHGFKLLARHGSQTQEVFVVTALAREAVEAALLAAHER